MPEYVKEEKGIFLAALERITGQEREEYLRDACGNDPELLKRVKALLSVHEESQGPLDAPAPGVRPADTTDLPLSEGPGTVIGPYKLREQIGEGGFGLVFMAEQQQPLRRKVAIKVIKPGMDSRQVIARFEAERQALALMDHPNIARVLEAGETDSGRPYFAMELVRGVPITDYCDEHRLITRARLNLFMSVCQAVLHAHQKGIIHRDIKPSNVLVTLHDGVPVVKVIDFGIAKALGPQLTDKSLCTGYAQLVGTPLYMSPEQAELSGLDIDTRSDIYSLGVLLYELLTGMTPFDKKRLHEVGYDEMRRIIREEEPSKPSTRLSTLGQAVATVSERRQSDPRRLSQLLRGELDWIVMKALEKDRNRRYETAGSFAADVERYLKDEPVAACPPSAWYRFRKFVGRNRVAVLAASAMLLTLVAGIVGTSWGLVEAWRQTTAADKARDNETEQHRQAVEQWNRAEGDAARAAAEASIARAEAARAEAEAGIARALNNFLQTDLLGTDKVGHRPLVGKDSRSDPNITVVQLLNRAAKAIDGKFSGQPLTEAAIRLTVGDTYRALGRYEEALPHLERSVQLRSLQLGLDHLDTLHSKNNLASLYGALGKLERAEPLFKEVITSYTAQLGPAHSTTLTAKNNLATFYLRKGQFDLAERLFKAVLAAEVIQHANTLITRSNLAMLYNEQGKYELAEPMLKEVLADSVAQLGGNHLDTQRAKNALASVYWAQRKFDKAEPLYLEALAGFTGQLGADHPETLYVKNNLATVYSGQRKYDSAEPLFREVLEHHLAKLGAAHPDTLNSKLNLALNYHNQRKYDLAEPLDQEALAGFTKLFGAEHPQTLASTHNLAFLYEVQRKYDRAEPLFREAIEASRKKLGIFHPKTQNSMRHLIVCLELCGRPAEAEPFLRELVDAWSEKPSTNLPPYPGYHPLCDLGYNLLLQKKGADAEKVLWPCLEVYQKTSADAWITFHAQSMLGGALFLEKKYADAEPLLLEGYLGMKQRAPSIPMLFQKRLTDAIQRLVQLYEAWGKADEAAKWRKELEARQAAPPTKP
jgi:serine/threonine protein kinase/tetratricopeptide (TPR) repeat protein